MKTTFSKIGMVLGLAIVLFGVATPQTAQANPSRHYTTTLASAVSGTGTKYAVFSVASATNMVVGQDMLVDREVSIITAINGTNITVNRGQESTRQTPHASGATVIFNTTTAFRDTNVTFQGSCVWANMTWLPHVNFASGEIEDCLNGFWVVGHGQGTTGMALAGNSRFRIEFPPTGAVAITSLNTNGTAAGATTEIYCTEVFVPNNIRATGLAFANGTTATTDFRFAILAEPGGNVIATSALAGAVTGTTSAYQQQAFINPTVLVGPATYLGCYQMSGTTDTTRMVVTGVNANVLAGKTTGATAYAASVFVAPATVTVPTTFTTVNGGYGYVY